MWLWHHLQSDLPLALGFVAPMACLAAGTRVRTWDGKSRKISDLVTKKEQVDLLGMDRDGRPIPLKIVRWFRSEQKDQRWVAVHVENTKQAIYCTPDHKVWVAGRVKPSRGRRYVQYPRLPQPAQIPLTMDGGTWRYAEELISGDLVPIPRQGHNSLIHGTLLGDGHATACGQLMFGHCAAQEGWLRAKAAVFTDVRILPTISRGYKLGAPGFMCRAKNIGPVWRRRFYHGRKKQFVDPPDDAALAVWYGDDGSLQRVGNSYAPRISIAGFLRRTSVLRWAREQFGRRWVKLGQRDTHGEIVRLTGPARAAFFARIAPWLHPTMAYKLPPAYQGRYNGWMDHPAFQVAPVEDVVEWHPSRWHRRRNIRYCVEVDHPTHRYFTSGGLVSNSDFGAWKHWAKIARLEGEYAAADPLQTHRVGGWLIPAAIQAGMWDVFVRDWHERDRYVLRPSHVVGVPVNKPVLVEYHESLQRKLARILVEIKKTAAEGVLKPKAGYSKPPQPKIPKWWRACAKAKHNVTTIPHDDQFAAMLDSGTYALDALRRDTRLAIKGLGLAVSEQLV